MLETSAVLRGLLLFTLSVGAMVTGLLLLPPAIWREIT